MMRAKRGAERASFFCAESAERRKISRKKFLGAKLAERKIAERRRTEEIPLKFQKNRGAQRGTDAVYCII